jgi:hypothetical protein
MDLKKGLLAQGNLSRHQQTLLQAASATKLLTTSNTNYLRGLVEKTIFTF